MSISANTASHATAPARHADAVPMSAPEPAAAPARMVEVHLEELGQHSWVRALLNTLSGLFGSAQFRFVARPVAVTHDSSQHVAVSPTFPVMRWADLDDTAEPNTWIELARAGLRELDADLVGHGWRRRRDQGKHWWSLRYEVGS